MDNVFPFRFALSEVADKQMTPTYNVTTSHSLKFPSSSENPGSSGAKLEVIVHGPKSLAGKSSWAILAKKVNSPLPQAAVGRGSGSGSVGVFKWCFQKNS